MKYLKHLASLFLFITLQAHAMQDNPKSCSDCCSMATLGMRVIYKAPVTLAISAVEYSWRGTIYGLDQLKHGLERLDAFVEQKEKTE